jgi:hypothetical protein
LFLLYAVNAHAQSSQWLNVTQFGAICDGQSHPLSQKYSTLAAAQAVYPFVTSLSQQIDYSALKLASNTAFGADGLEHSTTHPELNSAIYIPHGICMLGNDTWRVAKASGIRIFGDATTSSQIKGNWIVLQFDGLWYSEIDNLSISSTQAAASSTVTISIASPAVVSNWSGPQLEAGDQITFSTTGALPTGVTAGTPYYVLPTGLTSTSFQFSTTAGGAAVNTSGSQSGTQRVTAPVPAVLDVDGNALGPATTFGVQGNNFYGLIVGGGPSPGATNVVAVCRRGGGSGQCSEMTWTNLHINSCNFACYYQNGFNAIGNVLVGGDMQAYQRYGIFLIAGSVKVLGTSFESTIGYQQLANGGCDIDASSAGANDTISVYGSRTESLCFYHGAWSQLADLRGITQLLGLGSWVPSGNWNTLNTLINAQDANKVWHMFRLTTTGIGGTTQPVWPSTNGATVSDGTAMWTNTAFNAVSIAEGSIDMASSQFTPSAGIVEGDAPGIANCGGGSPAATPGSTRWRGSVTEGSGATGCQIAIRFLYTTAIAPTCVVSSPSGAALTSYRVGLNASSEWVLTIVNPPSAKPDGNQFTWICQQ